MATNLALDDRLIAEAVRAGGHKTKKDAVTAALREYVKARRRLALLALQGRVDYDPGYDHKESRRLGARRVGRNGGRNRNGGGAGAGGK